MPAKFAQPARRLLRGLNRRRHRSRVGPLEPAPRAHRRRAHHGATAHRRRPRRARGQHPQGVHYGLVRMAELGRRVRVQGDPGHRGRHRRIPGSPARQRRRPGHDSGRPARPSPRCTRSPDSPIPRRTACAVTCCGGSVEKGVIGGAAKSPASGGRRRRQRRLLQTTAAAACRDCAMRRSVSSLARRVFLPYIWCRITLDLGTESPTVPYRC